MKKALDQKVVDKILAQVEAKTLSKSKAMVELYTLNMEIKDIATQMGVRYNFVYNVISNHCNMNGLKITTEKREGKSDKIIEMFLAGKTNKEISIDLKTPYQYVFNTIKKYKADQAKNNPTAMMPEQAEDEEQAQ